MPREAKFLATARGFRGNGNLSPAVMGVVSAEREVPRFAGMGAVQKSPSRRAVVLMSYTQKIQGDSVW